MTCVCLLAGTDVCASCSNNPNTGYDYLHFLDLCAERANEIQRENELKTFTNMCETLGFVQVVRCKDCEFAAYDGKECMRINEWDDSLWFPVDPEGFCAWGERNGETE